MVPKLSSVWGTTVLFVKVFVVVVLVKHYYADYKQAIAIKEQKQEKIADTWVYILDTMGIQCPQVVYCQMVHETWFFRSKVFQQNNNPFGMKENSREYDIKGGNLNHAKYKDIYDALCDYRAWQKQFSKGRTFKDNEEYIKFLGNLNGKGLRYAEDPQYEKHLRKYLKKIFKTN